MSSLLAEWADHLLTVLGQVIVIEKIFEICELNHNTKYDKSVSGADSIHFLVKRKKTKIIILVSYTALYHTPRGISSIKALSILSARYVELCFRDISFIHVASCNGLQGAVAQYSVCCQSDQCTVFFYVYYTAHGTNSFTSHPNDKTSRLSVLL